MTSTSGSERKNAHFSPLRRLLDEAAKFGVVGLINLVLQISVFNALRGTIWHKHPVTALIASHVVATISAYFMNRHWSFKHRDRIAVHRETMFFFGINIIAIAGGAGILAFSRYLLDLDSSLADNAANFIGIGVGTLLRFWAYRRFVWPEGPPPPMPPDIAFDGPFHLPVHHSEPKSRENDAPA